MVLMNRLVKPTIHEKAGLTKPGKVGDFFLIRESKFGLWASEFLVCTFP
jgi:hypothetical protein